MFWKGFFFFLPRHVSCVFLPFLECNNWERICSDFRTIVRIRNGIELPLLFVIRDNVDIHSWYYYISYTIRIDFSVRRWLIDWLKSCVISDWKKSFARLSKLRKERKRNVNGECRENIFFKRQLCRIITCIA